MAETTQLNDLVGPEPTEKTDVTQDIPKFGEEQPVQTNTSLRKAHLAKEYAAQGRDPATGQFVKTEEPTQEKPEQKTQEQTQQEALTERERGFKAAMEDERRKRQEYERKVQEYEQRQQKQPEGEQPQSFWDDPEGYFRKFQEQLQAQSNGTRLSVSEMVARNKHADFDEKIAEFANIVQATPGLAQQWIASPDPAEFAYQTAASNLRLKQAGSIEQMKMDMEKDLRVKIKAELKAEAEKEAKERSEIPGSLSDARSTTRPATAWHGPTPLDEVIGRES